MTAIKSGILGDEDKVYSLQMPTSAGKTSLCEILIYHEVKSRGKRVLFLVPFRALASEIKEGVSKRLESAGVTVIASHGGNIPTRSESATAESADVLICTSTLAEGVNLPIRTLVVHTIKRYDGSVLRSIEKRSIKNIVGRVGRAGKETRGRIIFANNEERAEAENVFRDINMEPAYGALYKLIESMNRVVTQQNIQLSNESLSEMASNWPSLLQYGLYDLQQLDLFEKGASDRLGVWGISRYLKTHNILLRDRDLLNFLRHNAANIINFLNQDTRVPTLSAERVCEELKIYIH